MGEIVEFPSNGGTALGYLAVPEGGGGIPLVVIQEWWGLVPHIQDVCDRFAAEGFVALAPDLFHGESTTEPDEAGKLMMALNVDQAARDMGGAVDKVAEVAGSDRVGVTGFCMGGGLALVLAAKRPDKVKAVVPWYGLIPWPDAEPDWSQLDAKVLGHYASEDDFFGPDKVADLQRKLDDAGKDARLHVVPGAEHAFFNDTRPEVYDPEASRACFAETVDFLRDTLG
ncbi:MAG: dienelactone hydrolase family protein [Acidimicrobiales bacterium]|nr:dienelactone hydrolase family protein [Acidimicrobiales bacterium]